MTHRNKSMKSIDLFSEACSRIIKEYNDNYIEEREDGYKVEETVYFLDDNTEYYYDVHTPDGEKASVDGRSIDAIIDYHKKHGKFPASSGGVVQHPDYKPRS